jgi:hypothetical protein
MEVYLAFDRHSRSMNWLSRYEMRRECQEILPGLLLGPFTASKSIKTLHELRITHMYSDNYTLSFDVHSNDLLEYVFATQRKHSLSSLGSQNSLHTWF